MILAGVCFALFIVFASVANFQAVKMKSILKLGWYDKYLSPGPSFLVGYKEFLVKIKGEKNEKKYLQYYKPYKLFWLSSLGFVISIISMFIVGYFI